MSILLIILFSLLYIFGAIGYLQIWLEAFGSFNQFNWVIKTIVALFWPIWCIIFGFSWTMVTIEFWFKK